MGGGVVGRVADAFRSGLRRHRVPHVVHVPLAECEDSIADKSVADDLLVAGVGALLPNYAVHLRAMYCVRPFDRPHR